MTQSAVSKRLQRIEAEWDIKVVKRTSKGVIFTPSGDALAHLSLTVLEGMDALRKRFRLQRCHKKGRGQQLLRFGITNSFARLNLSDLVSAYSKACDELSVHPILGSWDSNIKSSMKVALMSLFALIAMKPTVGAGGSLRKSCISLCPGIFL